MATVGVKSAYVGILGTDGQLLKDETKGLSKNGVVKLDLQSAKGIVSANITGLAATITKIYGSNAVADSSVGIPAPQCVLSANDMPHEIVDKITGMTIDENGAATSYTNMLPSVPLIVETNAVKDGKSIYFAFFDDNVIRGEMNLQTNNASEQRIADAVTFSANARGKDGANYKIFYGDQPSFSISSMLTEVFPGYAPASGDDDGDTGLDVFSTTTTSTTSTTAAQTTTTTTHSA